MIVCLNFRRLIFFMALGFLASFLGMTSFAGAQSATADDDAPIIARGDAVVTGFSGLMALKPKPNAKLEDYLIIDTQAAALQVFDLSQMFGPNDARLVDAPRQFTVPAGQIGQVFGVALDDGQPATGPALYQDAVPNIYATATSVYGLQIVETKQVGKERVRERAKVGSPDASWMAGQFGIGGGPGSIWKIDGLTGEASLLATVALDGVDNSGPALGSIAFDPSSRSLYVSDLQTGMIHAFDLSGEEVSRFDHGTKGRSAQGLEEVVYDPKSRVNITDPAFNAEDGATWGFAARERRVWGLSVHNGRLFYAAVEGPDIWSVGIAVNGEFKDDARLEIEVESKSGEPISAIAFGRDGTIYLSQRGHPVRSYDYKVMSEPDTAQTLRYRRERQDDGTVIWQAVPEEYAVGHDGEHRSGNGGVALGYGYDKNGFIRYDRCDATLWSTGEILRQSAVPDPRLADGGSAIVNGLQGNPIGTVIPDNAPPLASYFVDYDGQFDDPSYRGHMGQVAVWSCGRGHGIASAPPPPRGPRIQIAKKCSPAGLGDKVHCRVTLFNSGDEAPLDPVGFSDVAEILRGPPGAGRIEIVSAIPNHPAWQCSALPTDRLTCDIDGDALQPGRRRSVDVVMDVSGIARTPGFRLRNCATLDDDSQTACDRAGGDLVVSKVGDSVCEAGGFCTFDISVFNDSRRSFDGRMFLADNIAIPGVPVADIAFISPRIPGCDPATLPFQCTVPMTIGPHAERTFEVTVAIPANAVPPGKTVQGRNCFFASDPEVVPDRGRRAASFLRSSLQTLRPGGPSDGPGFACWNFTVQSPGLTPIPPKCEVPVAKLRILPKPATFTDANETVKVAIELTNTGNNKFDDLDNWKVTAPGLKNLTCATQSKSIRPRAFATYQAEYTTKVNDVGMRSLSLKASATATSACGQVKQIDATGTVNSVVKPAMTVAVTAAPATYTTANEKITYTYKVTNAGTSPVTKFTLTDSKATGIICKPTTLGITEAATCTGTYTTTAADVGNAIDSTASITGTAVAGPVPPLPPVTTSVSYTGKSTGPIPQRPLVSLSVVPKPKVFAAAKEKIDYAFTVRNNGKVPLDKFTLTDTKVTGLTCKPAIGGALAAGATASCTGSYTTAAADVGNQIDSTANVTATVDPSLLNSIKNIFVSPSSSGAATATANATVAFAGKPIVNKLPPTVIGTPPPGVTVTPGEADLSLTMVASPTKFSGENQTIALTYTIRATGSVAVAKFTLSDDKVKDMKCQPGNTGPSGGPLDLGDTVTCTGSYTTTTADTWKVLLFTGIVDGEAVAPASTKLTKAARVRLPFGLPPDLTLSVNFEPENYDRANEKISYYYTIKNTSTGPVPAFDLTDTRVKDIKCTPANPGASGGPINPGATVECTGSYLTAAGDVGRDIAGTAKLERPVGGDFELPDPVDTLVRYSGTPELRITQYKPTPATFGKAGETIGFFYEIRNSGRIPVSGITLADDKAIGIRCQPANTGPNGGAIAVGKSRFCSASYLVKAADIGKDIVSTATITATVSSGIIPTPVPVKATVKYVVPPVTVAAPAGSPELEIFQYGVRTYLHVPSTFSAANEVMSFRISAWNEGGAGTSGTIASDKITNIKCTKTPMTKVSGATVTPLLSLNSFECYGEYTTTAADVGKDIEFEVTATAMTAAGPVPRPAGASRKLTVKFLGYPELNMSVRAEPEFYRAANTAIAYTYNLENTGPVAITSFEVTDSKATGIKCAPANTGSKGGPLAPGAKATCTGTYTTKPGDLPKSILTVANVTGTTAAGKLPTQKPANKEVDFIGVPKLTAHSYMPRPATFSRANEKIEFAYSIFNYGDLPVTSFTITDSKVKNIKCPPKNAGPSGGPIAITNGDVTCTGIYTTTAADVGKDIESEMTVSGTSVLGPIKATPRQVKKATVTYKAPAEKPEMMAYYYVASPETFSAAGEVIAYTYDVANFGNVPITSFKLTDSKGNDIKCKPANTTNGGGLIGIRKLAHCYGTYTTTAADVGKDLESEMSTTGMTAAGPVPTKPHASKKVVVKFVAPPAPVAQNFEMMQVKAVPSTFSAAGEKIDYVMIVKGNGAVPATAAFMVTGKKIADIKCAPAYTGPIGRGPFNIVSDCKGTYTTTAADVGKDIESQADVVAMTAAGMSPAAAGGSKTATVKFAGKASFELDHECSVAKYSSAGQVISCDFIVRNTGNVPIKSCRISGSRIKAVCPAGLIPPGQSIVVRGSYTSTAADVGKDIVFDYLLEGQTI